MSMLSRIAVNCLWLARYLERTENTARLIGVAQQQSLMPEFCNGDPRPWRWLVDIAADDKSLAQLPAKDPASAAQELLILDREYSSSIWSCLRAVRENARTARSRLTNDLWVAANTTWIEAQSLDANSLAEHGIANTLDWASHRCMWIRATIEDLLEDYATDIISVGRTIERIDNVIRVLRAYIPAMKSYGKDSHIPGTPGYRLWDSMLMAAGAHDWYRRLYGPLGNLPNTVELIARYDKQSRSLLYNANKLAFSLGHLAANGTTTCLTRATNLAQEIDKLSVADLISNPERLKKMLLELYNISDAVAIDHCGQEPYEPPKETGKKSSKNSGK